MKITIDIEPSELKDLLESFKHCDHHCKHVTAPKLIETARKLDKAIEEAKPQPEPQTAPAPAKKPRAGNLTAYKTKSEAPKAPVCVDTWSTEELNLLRTCPTHKDAQFVYHSHFGDARNDNAIYQRWIRLQKSGNLIAPGKAKVICGMLKLGFTGVIQSFTDDHQCANILFTGDPATYQIGIENLKPIQGD